MAKDLGPAEYSQEDTYSSYEQTDAPTPGATDLSDLTDVDLTNPTDGQTLVYDAATEKWVNGSASGGGAVVLDGIYESSGVNETVTLEITAGALMSAYLAGPVLVRFQSADPDYPDEINTFIVPVIFGIKLSIEGYDDTYSFQLGGVDGNRTQSVVASEPVVFIFDR